MKCLKCDYINEVSSGTCSECGSTMSEGVELMPNEVSRLNLSVVNGAGFWIRFGARLIDIIIGTVLGLLVGGITGILFFFLARAGHMAANWAENIRQFSFPGLCIGLVGAWMYHTFTEGIASASVGKLICGLRIVNLDGSPIKISAAFKRGLAYHWDALFFGLVAYSSMKKSSIQQRYGDVWAKTAVVRSSDVQAASTVPFRRVLMGVVTGLFIWATFIVLELYVKSRS